MVSSSVQKVAFITGASSGIGAACVKSFASQGYAVAFCARSTDKLSELQKQVASPTTPLLALPLDVTDEPAVRAAVGKVFEQFGRIDVLINNAGLALGSPRPFWEQTIEDVQQVVNTNTLGAMYVAHAVLNAGMLKQGHGDIVNVSSITGLDAPPGEASYHTSKTGLEGFSNALRQELTGHNLRVLVVRPGFVGGDANFHYTRHGEGHNGPQGSSTWDGMQPLVPDDVARVILSQVSQPERVSLRSVDIVPTSQRSMYVADRTWNERNGVQQQQ